MRSYYEHLETAMGPMGAVPSHPITRSSAIFPALNRTGISTRILFMGYWLLKRNIHEVLAVVNLRSEKGALLGRQTFTINEAKTYRVELKDALTHAGFSSEILFTGTLEIEFFSTVNLVFPFPAVVINYYGPQFSTVVHTAQRIYNDFEDLKKNSQTKVPESGFNIYADTDREPFIGLINGPLKVENALLEMQFFNSNKETLTSSLKLGNLEPYELKMIFPAKEVDLLQFLNGKVGAGKVRFDVNWIFPRLLVGNFQYSLPALTVTHTYYDTTSAASDSDYWKPAEPGWFPATLMLPGAITKDYFTNVYFYPIYSPTAFHLDVELYSSQGKLLGRKERVLLIKSPTDEFYKIEIKKLAEEMQLESEIDVGVRIIARPEEEGRLPARIKLGLDVGTTGDQMPCNICTNLQPFNPALEGKPSTFRWAPVLADQTAPKLWIMNSAPHIDYTRSAEVTMTFHRERDASKIVRTFTLLPHGFRVLYPNEDPELKAFFENQIGWFTLVSTNPYTSTYYFAENTSGLVGGDHGF